MDKSMINHFVIRCRYVIIQMKWGEKLQEGEYDSLTEEGKFVYNPEAINSYYKEELKDKPKIVSAAKKIMRAVYDRKTQFELTGEDECDKYEFEKAYRLAAYSSPLISCVDISSEDYKTYNVIYLPIYSEEGLVENEDGVTEAGKKFNNFESFVTDMINDNLTPEDDYMERAEKIYKVMLEDIEMDYEDDRLFNAVITREEVADRSVAVMDIADSKKLKMWEYQGLYQFMLTQLGIEFISIAAGGTYTDQPCDKLNEILSDNRSGWSWTIVIYGDKAYNCDIFMDEITLDVQRETQKNYESDMAYFGMSDETRKKSVNYQGRAPLIYMTASHSSDKPWDLPVCVEDY